MSKSNREESAEQLVKILKALGFRRASTETQKGRMLAETFFNESQLLVTVDYTYQTKDKK